MTKERMFQKSYAPELLAIAENDLIAARALADNLAVRRETVFFNIQQAVEKALKALLCYRGRPVPMTHDIPRILDRLGVPHGVPRGDDVADLSDFAAIRRYEDGVVELTGEEIEATIAAAEQILAFCRGEIGSEGGTP